MGFDLKKFKKKTSSDESNLMVHQVDKLVVGSDISCFLYINELNVDSSFLWLNDKQITLEHYTFWQETPLGFYRDEKIDPDQESFFYKNQAWHKLGARVKPLYPFTEEEKFFSGKPAELPPIDNLKLNWPEDKLLNGQISSIKQIEQQEDLVDQYHYLIELKNKDQIKCKEIIWSDSLKGLVEAYEGELSDELKSYSYSSNDLKSFYVEFQVEEIELDSLEIANGIGFLPYSMSNNHGHCVFRAKKMLNNWKIGSFYLIQDEENDVNEEKILAHFKRILTRVYPSLIDKLALNKLVYSESLFRRTIEADWPMTSLPAHISVIGKELPSNLGFYFSRSISSVD